LPEQIVLDRINSTSAAFNMASQASNPAAMLLNSMSPIEFFSMVID
jgi:hypothetical protein